MAGRETMKNIIVLIVVCTMLLTPNLSRADTHAVKGLWLGAAIGGGTGALFGLLVAKSWDDNDICGGSPNCNSDPNYGKAAAYLGLVGAGAGALIGLGIGALIPKDNKIQLTPVVYPDSNGVNAGANLQVKF